MKRDRRTGYANKLKQAQDVACQMSNMVLSVEGQDAKSLEVQAQQLEDFADSLEEN